MLGVALLVTTCLRSLGFPTKRKSAAVLELMEDCIMADIGSWFTLKQFGVKFIHISNNRHVYII